MTWKSWLKMVLAAAAGGAVERLGHVAGTGDATNFKQVGASTAVGALTGILLLLVNPKSPKPTDQDAVK